MKKLIVLVAALCMVATSAYAAEWNFYGSARVSTFWTDLDNADTTDFSQALQGNSRIGAKVKANDEISGGFEYGTAGGNANIRLLWGEWNFGAGSLLIGQQYSPLCMFYSNQVYEDDIDLFPYGGVYSGREPMLQLKFGDFKIAAVRENQTVAGATATEADMPAIEASYRFAMDTFHIALAGGFQTFDVIAGGQDYSVDSWEIALGAGLKFGPAYLNGNVYMGTNAGNLTWIDTGSGNAGRASFNGTDIIDNDALGFLVVLGFQANEMFGFEAGYSYAETEWDVANSTEDEVEAYYVQATINLAKGVSITPEIGRIDYKEAGQEEINYVGAKWQLNF